MSGMLFCPVFWSMRDHRHGKFESVNHRSFIFVGRPVSRLRNQRGLSQPALAVELQLAGWHKASRDTVAKLEGGTLRVDLIQVRYLAATLGIPLPQFLSKIDWNKADLLTNKNDNQ
jgi:transcriptional regulator with XRE-family HTH domain